MRLSLSKGIFDRLRVAARIAVILFVVTCALPLMSIGGAGYFSRLAAAAVDDCVLDGGLAHCTDPVVVSSRADGQSDDRKWVYQSCDWQGEANGSCALSYDWCLAAGGTPTGPPNYCGCSGLSEDFLDDNPTHYKSSPKQDATMAAYAAIKMPHTCSGPEKTLDSGWDAPNPNDFVCGPTASQQKNGITILSPRRVDFTAYSGASCQANVTKLTLKRQRALQCPDGYLTRSKSNGDIQCYEPVTACCSKVDDSIKVGNPINGVTGGKFQEEVDYDQNGLRFSRIYRNDGYFHLAGITEAAQNPDPVVSPSDVWRHNWQRDLWIVQGSAYVSAILRLGNGDVVYFDLSGKAIHNREGGTEKLEQIPGGWKYTNAFDDVETYDDARRMVAFAHRDGLTTSLSYNVDGTLHAVTAPDGRQLVLGYYESAHLWTVTEPGGEVISYGYDPKSRPMIVTYPGDGPPFRAYYYEDNTMRLTRIDDENAVDYADYTYTAGRVTTEQHAGGVQHLVLDYRVVPDFLSTYVHMLGPNNTEQYRYYTTAAGVAKISQIKDNCPQCDGIHSPQAQQVFTYDTAGNLKTKRDANSGLTCYGYDLTRNLETSRLEGVAPPYDCTSANFPTSVRKVSTTWHANFRVPTQRKVGQTTGTPDSQTDWTYNSRGQVLTRTMSDPQKPANPVRTWTYTYCEQEDVTAGACPLVGLLKNVDGPRTDVSDITTYTYYQATDESGCSALGGTCHRLGDLYRVTNAMGQATTYVSYDKNGRVTRIQDTNGVFTDMTYHARGWLLTRTVRANSDGTPNASFDATTTFAYDNAGNLTQVTQPDQSYMAYTYDGAHRLVKINDALGNTIDYCPDGVGSAKCLDGNGNRLVEQTKDPSGTLRREISRQYDKFNHLVALLNSAAAPVHSYTHPPEDSYGVYPNGYDLNGNPVYSIDGTSNHVGTEQQYDSLNRLVKTLQDHAGTGATHDTTTQYAYDTRDNLRSATDPSGLVTTYTYDGLNNLTDLYSPDTGHTSYAYDAAGNRTSQTDARPITSMYSYDALNRLVGISYPTSSLNVTYAYDQPNATTGCDGSYPIGRMTTMTDASGSTIYCYDQRGNVIATKQATNGLEIDLQYTYTLGDRLGTVTYPSGNFVVYGRDSAGRIVSVDYYQSGGRLSLYYPLVSNITYYPFGPVNSISFPTGTTLTKTYDQDYAIDSVASSAPGGLVIDASVDALGNLTSASDSLGANPATRSYQYDPLYRLSGVTDAAAASLEAYTYNKTGDRLSKSLNGGTAEIYAYGSPQTTHRLLSVGGVSRGYDLNGNTTQRNGNAFVYDERNRLTQAGGWTYSYNGRGERVMKQLPQPWSGGGSVVGAGFGYSPAGTLLAEYRQTTEYLGHCTPTTCMIGSRWSPDREYIWADGLLVGLALVKGPVYYIETDQLGTPRRIASADDGSIVWSWDYFGSAFGENAPNEDPGDTGETFTFNLRFPGQYYDSETGLNYNYFRDDEPGTGRYVESDPVGLSAGPSTYSYVSSAPLVNSDPTGQMHWTGTLNYGDTSPGMPSRWARGWGRAFRASSDAKVNLTLKSDCQCGKRIWANIEASRWSAPGLFDGPNSAITADVALDDSSSTPDASNLLGPLILNSGGGLLGAGGNITAGSGTGTFSPSGTKFLPSAIHFTGESVDAGFSGRAVSCDE